MGRTHVGRGVVLLFTLVTAGGCARREKVVADPVPLADAAVAESDETHGADEGPREAAPPAGGACAPLATNAWRTGSAEGAPVLITPSLEWTGREVLAVGRKLVAGLYDPCGDRWRAVPPPPSALAPASARHVWTGSRLIAASAGAAAELDPETNRWRDLGAPADLAAGQLLMWHGEVVVVPPACNLDRLRIYAPKTGTWRTLTTTDGPTPGGADYRCTVGVAGGELAVVDTVTSASQFRSLDGATGRWVIGPMPPTRNWNVTFFAADRLFDFEDLPVARVFTPWTDKSSDIGAAGHVFGHRADEGTPTTWFASDTRGNSTAFTFDTSTNTFGAPFPAPASPGRAAGSVGSKLLWVLGQDLTVLDRATRTWTRVAIAPALLDAGFGLGAGIAIPGDRMVVLQRRSGPNESQLPAVARALVTKIDFAQQKPLSFYVPPQHAPAAPSASASSSAHGPHPPPIMLGKPPFTIAPPIAPSNRPERISCGPSRPPCPDDLECVIRYTQMLCMPPGTPPAR